MTAITQKIPNFIGGISQQPDELQPVGTLKDALNVIPDVKGVVAKRPGTQFMGALTNNSEGKWYSYYRDETEEYVIRIRRNGVVDVWTTDGKPLPVSYVNEPINAIDDVAQGLPTPESGAAGATSQYPNCDLSQFSSTLDAVRQAEYALVSHKEAIEELNVKRNLLSIEAEGEYFYDLEYKTLKVGVAKDHNDNVIIAAGRPEDESGYTITEVYKVTEDIKQRDAARLFAYRKVRNAAATELAAVEAEIATKNSETLGLVQNLQTARAAWEPVAAACGVYENPFGYSRSIPLSTPTPVEYFAHTNDEDLQLITVNDYTFVVNRNKIPTMSGAGTTGYKPNSEAFVSLDLLATDKPYTLFIDLINEDTAPQEFTRATQVSISPSSWEDGDDTCNKAGSEQVTATGSNGKTMDVIITSVGSQYLVGPDPDTGGTNYDCRYQTRVQLVSSGKDWKVGDTASASLKGRGYTIRVESTSTRTTGAEIIVESPATTTLDSNEILENLKNAIEAGSDFEAEIVGNGIFITDPTGNKPFKVTTPDRAYMTCINNEVNNVSDLPDQCVDGYTVKVANSFVEEDDYWVRFKTELNTTDSVGDAIPAGAGVWEECADPTVDVIIDYASMPYQIRRLPNQTFEISPIRWGSRTVGDDITNPKPSFIGRPINKMVFFRNRMAILSGESVIFSRPNEYFTFWAKTALVVNDADPIDLNVSSTFPAILYDAIDTAAGLMLFSENQQHLVVTDNTDVFSPDTAVVKSVGTYKYNVKTTPLDMGQTIGFLNDAGYRSRYFEIVPSRDDRYQAVEISKPVDQLLPSGINLTTSSKDNSFIAFAVKDSSEVFVYRYYTDGQQRKQSAWFRWDMHGKIKHHFMIGDAYYIVTENPAGDGTNITNLQKLNLVIDKGQSLINVTSNMREYDYQIHLDGYFMVTPSEMFYNNVTNTTSFRLPIGYHGDVNPIAYEIGISKTDHTSYIQTGRTAEVTLTGAIDNVQGTVKGDWTRQNLVTGFVFDMSVKMPTFYVTQTNASTNYSVKDTRGYLTIHRLNLNFEALGSTHATVSRRGRDPFTILYESTPADYYNFNTSAVELGQSRVLPVYDKNKHVDIELHSRGPEPVILVSAEWEGDYSDKNYKRV